MVMFNLSHFSVRGVPKRGLPPEPLRSIVNTSTINDSMGVNSDLKSIDAAIPHKYSIFERTL